MGKNETVSIEQQVSELQEQKRSELEKIQAKFKEKEQALISTLKTEIADLKASLKAKEKSLEKLTGKPTVSANGEGRTKTPIRNLVLTELKGGQVMSATAIADSILTKHPTVNKNSVMTQMSNYAKAGIVENANDGYRITDAG